VLVVVAILPVSPDHDISDQQLLWIFVIPSQQSRFASGCTIDTRSPHHCTVLIFVAVLTHRVWARPDMFSPGLSWSSN